MKNELDKGEDKTQEKKSDSRIKIGIGCMVVAVFYLGIAGLQAKQNVPFEQKLGGYFVPFIFAIIGLYYIYTSYRK